MSKGKGEPGPITYKTNKYEKICNDCLCGLVKMKMNFKVRGLKFKSRWVRNKKKLRGFRSRDRVRSQ